MSHSTKSFVALALLACMASASAQQAPVLDPNGKAVSISAGSRAMPTQTTSVVEPARYQHVFVDSKSPSGRTVQTISLQDAVANDVLASSELEIQRQQAIERGSLVWIVTEAGGVRRPSDLEGAGGEGAAAVNASEVNFALNEADILNPERLSSLLRVASRLNGVFHVVGYADETGPATRFFDVPELAQQLVDIGVAVAMAAGIARGIQAGRAAQRACASCGSHACTAVASDSTSIMAPKRETWSSSL